jgi:hypothetical protein
MQRILAILLTCIIACCLARRANAESAPNIPDRDVASLLAQNRLLADVARDDPADLWTIVQKLNVLATNPRDGGASRAGSTPTPAETAQIAANPALRLANDNDPAATLALLRTTNEELRRARLRDRQSQPRQLALVIGNSGDAKWGRLATTSNDARLIARTLAGQGFELLGGHALIDADKPHLLQAIRTFAGSIGPDTVALFYYAGHGAQSGARNFIVPAGAPLPRTGDDYDRTLVAMDDAVLKRMQQANGHLNIIILDACRDVPPLLSRSAALTSPRQSARGLAPMNAPSPMGGTIIMFSTGPNSIARDSVNGEPDSPFATAFAAAVGTGGLEIRDVFDRTQAAVAAVTHHQQEPWISYSAVDRFYFNAGHPPGGNLMASTSDARPPFCPKPGTTITLQEPGGTVTGTYQPVDPTDPALCRVSNSIGQVQGLLYNLYDTRFLTDEAPVRAALESLLSGRKNRVFFQVQLKTRFPFPKYLESWTRLGQETLSTDGHAVQTIVFEREREGLDDFASVYNHRKWKLWYDPTIGVVDTRELPLTEDVRVGRPSGDVRVISVQPF